MGNISVKLSQTHLNGVYRDWNRGTYYAQRRLSRCSMSLQEFIGSLRKYTIKRSVNPSSKELVRVAVEEIRVVVKGKNLDVTPALREYAQKKIYKTAKFFDARRVPLAEVVLKIERDRQIAEITLQVGGLLVRGEGITDDMYASLDEAIDRIERQIRKHKTRILKRQQGPGLREVVGNNSSVDALEDRRDEVTPPRIVKTKRFAIKPMSVEEAVLQMDLLGHDFFVFGNGETGQVNVVYRRRSGDYGLIEPEY